MNLRWNSSDYGNIKDLRIPPHRIWKPDVLMYNRSVEVEFAVVNAIQVKSEIVPAMNYYVRFPIYLSSGWSSSGSNSRVTENLNSPHFSFLTSFRHVYLLDQNVFLPSAFPSYHRLTPPLSTSQR